ncbi:MAG: N-acetylglucosamine kinase [Bacteroidota bacterium]
MILIADSGATKTDWRFIDEDGSIEQYKTIGFNPYYQEAKPFIDSIKESELSRLKKLDRIYFYGAGCSSEQTKKKVEDALKSVFSVSKIEANHDLLASARALCGKECGIVCILGTGSNSALYDGEQLVDNVESLGFILADEGSGAHFGKKLLSDFLRKNMPEEIRILFEKSFSVDKDSVLKEINGSNGGTYLASFSKFIFRNISEPYFYKLVYNCFHEFFDTNVMVYDNVNNLKVHFSGSIAYNFNSILRTVSHDFGVTLGNILESPISGLTLYHQS